MRERLIAWWLTRGGAVRFATIAVLFVSFLIGASFAAKVSPLIVPAALLVAGGVVLWLEQTFRRVSQCMANGECPYCGYDLRASPNRCPECGTPRGDA